MIREGHLKLLRRPPPKRFRNLDPGRHKVTVVATDLVGQVDPTPAKYRWRVTN